MMKLVFDTNIILDAAMNRPGAEDANALIQAVISGEMIGLVTASSVTDIHDIVRKRAGEEIARKAVYNVLSIFDAVQVDAEACMAALNLPMKDYEDAVAAVCAEREGADCIVTGDIGFIEESGSPVKVLPPAGVRDLLG